jgi:serine kinase of HPr protein (carbohydrate metabolism regulator)
VTVTAPDAAALAAIRDAVAVAEHPMAPSREQRYGVALDAGGYALTEEGDALGSVTTVQEASETIVARSRRRALELAALKGWVRLGAALVDLDGVRLLLAGPPGAGKTLLALRLGLRGGRVQGDESVLLRDGVCLAVPAPLRVPDGAPVAMEELAELLGALPRLGGVAALDPGRHLGGRFELRAAPIDHVVVLDTRPGRIACRASTQAETLTDLALWLVATGEPRPVLARALAVALVSARCHRLHVGDLEAMETAIVAAAC